jgi:hypothetical protein
VTPVVSCATCGTQLRGTPKFCDECGPPTQASPASAEYKQVTVLFADLYPEAVGCGIPPHLISGTRSTRSID